jgi:large conductance mechanosensitive channel
MLKGFKEFVMRGNVLDLAVGIIIGAAFGKIVSSFVGDIMTPLLGLVLGKVDFTHMYLPLAGGGPYESVDAARKAGPVLTYGMFLQAVFDFLIVALAIFMLIQQVNKLKREPEKVAATPTTKPCPFCLSAIPLKATRCPNCTSQVQAA